MVAQLADAVFSAFRPGFYFVVVMTALILALAANTAFNGFPVLGSILAQDRYLPRQLHTRGDRLAFSNGIVFLSFFAVVLVVGFGAEVTAVCSTKNVELVRSLGADRVIDYTKDDFTKNGETYDVVFDAVGKHAFSRCRRSLKKGGAYVATDGLRNLFLAMWTSRIGDRKVLFPIPPHYTKKNVLLLKELIEAGKYRAVIDRSYPLDDVVEATRYVETEQKTGNVVLTVA